MLLPADQPAAVDEQREHQLGLRPQRLDGRAEIAVVRRPFDRQVELPVGVGGVHHVVDSGGVAARLEPVTDLGQLFWCASLGGELGGERLEHAS